MRVTNSRMPRCFRETGRSALIAGALVFGVCGGLPSAAIDGGLAAPSLPARQIAATHDLPACLLGEWRHSHEDDTTELRVYRPAGYRFPPSRGRTGFAFLTDGQLIAYEIAPADGILASPGRWTFTPPNLVTIVLDRKATTPESLPVASCSDELLTIAASQG